MPEKLNTAIAAIGIDVGKNSFHVVGQDEREPVCAARALFAAGDLMRSERGVLKARAPDATQQLEAATRQIGRGGDEVGQVVYIPFADGRPAFGHVLPTRSGTVRGRIEWASAFGPRPADAEDRLRPMLRN